MRLRSLGAAVAISVLAALTLATAATPVAAKKTTIQLMHWYFWDNATKDWVASGIKEFEKQHPDATVKQVQCGWGTGYTDKVLTMAAAGLPPDVVEVSGLLMTSIAGILTDAAPMVKTGGLDKAVNYPSMWRGCTYRGQTLAVPLGGGVQRGLFYNQDMMRNRGLNPDKPPTTWASFLDFCAKTTYDMNGDGKPDIKGTDSCINVYQMMEVGAGGTYTTNNGLGVDWDSDASLKALEFADAINRNKYIGTDAGMLNGKCGSYCQGAWDMTNVALNSKVKWGFSHYPTPSDDNVRLWASSDALGVCKVPPARQKLAWDLVKILTSAESEARLAANVGFPPMNKAAFAATTYKQLLERIPQAAQASEQMAYAYAPDPSPNDSNLLTIMSKYFNQVTSVKLGPREAAKKMQAEGMAYLARFAKRK